MDFVHADLILSQARFQLWDDVLDVPYPGGGFPYLLGMWRYARGLALAGKNQLGLAQVELDSLKAVAAATPQDAVEDINSARSLLDIALESLTGMIAFRRGNIDDAVSHLEQAVRGEDGLRDAVPSDWVNPVRHLLGAVLLQSGRAAQAEAVYREDLKRHPENGWALYGLFESLRQQGKESEGQKSLQRFKRAWTGADVTSSVMRF
jgi:tetratricopeptide (TPR) repeat protein